MTPICTIEIYYNEDEVANSRVILDGKSTPICDLPARRAAEILHGLIDPRDGVLSGILKRPFDEKTPLMNMLIGVGIKRLMELVGDAQAALQKEQLKKGLGKYLEEENLAYRLNWVMQDYCKAGEDDEEREHRFKCYKLFWDALEDENFFEPKKQNNGAEEYTDFTIYHPLKNGKGEYECIPYSFYGSLTSFSEDKDLIDFLRTCFYTEEECNEWIEKQKEQSFTHHQIDESLRDAVTHQMEDDGDVDDFVRKGIDDIAMKYAMLGARWQKEQKPVEWSSVDELKLQTIEAVITQQKGSAAFGGFLQEELIDFLESIRPQPKQEWSEEDENMLNSIIATCKLAQEDRDSSPARSLYKKQETFLKSLRPQPHWKPSEEQMEELGKAKDIYMKSSSGIASLYYDLKTKLM